MITPVLDLQGTPQLIDRIGPDTASTGDNGEFGAALSASLSNTHAAAGTSGSKDTVPDGAQKADSPNQSSAPSRTATPKTVTATNRSTSTTASLKTAGTVSSLSGDAEDAGVGAIEQVVASASSQLARASADSSTLASAAVPRSQTSADAKALSNPQSEALEEAEALGNSTASSTRVTLKQPKENVGGSEATETAKVYGSGAKVAESQGESKIKISGSKESGQTSAGKIAAQIASPAAGSIPNDALVAALAAVPAASLRAVPASSSTASDSVASTTSRGPVQAASSVDPTSLTLQSGTGSAKSGAVAAWGSIEPVNVSAAKDAIGRARDASNLPQVESATDVQSSTEAVASPSSTALLASSLNEAAARSTAVPVSTAFTIPGEQCAPSHKENALRNGTGAGLLGTSSQRSVDRNLPVARVRTAIASSATLGVPNLDSANSAAAILKKAAAASGNNNLAAGTLTTVTAKSGLFVRPVSTVGLHGLTAAESPATQAASPDQQTVGSVQTVAAASPTSGAQRSTAERPSSSEHVKTTDTAAVTSQPALAASAPSAQSSGSGSDASGSTSGAHTGGLAAVTAVDHVSQSAASSAIAATGAVLSAQTVQGAHQAVGTNPGSGALPIQGSASGQEARSAIPESESGHTVSTLHSAIADSHQTLVATPSSLEVGVHSGSQGWVKIRAEVGGEGEVSASLASSSPGGEQMLKGQLPALNAYLHSEQISATASVAERTGIAHGASTANGGATLQAGTSSSSGQDASLLHSGANQSMADRGSSQGDARIALPVQTASLNDVQTRYETSDAPSAPTTFAESSGQWLNVRV